MISDLLIAVAFTLLKAILFFLPAFNGLPPAFDSALNLFTPILSQVNKFLPISEMLTATTLYFSIILGIWLFKIGEWILSKIWPTGQMRLPI